MGETPEQARERVREQGRRMAQRDIAAAAARGNRVARKMQRRGGCWLTSLVRLAAITLSGLTLAVVGGCLRPAEANHAPTWEPIGSVVRVCP